MNTLSAAERRAVREAIGRGLSDRDIRRETSVSLQTIQSYRHQYRTRVVAAFDAFIDALTDIYPDAIENAAVAPSFSTAWAAARACQVHASEDEDEATGTWENAPCRLCKSEAQMQWHEGRRRGDRANGEPAPEPGRAAPVETDDSDDPEDEADAEAARAALAYIEAHPETVVRGPELDRRLDAMTATPTVATASTASAAAPPPTTDWRDAAVDAVVRALRERRTALHQTDIGRAIGLQSQPTALVVAWGVRRGALERRAGGFVALPTPAPPA